MCRLVAEAQRVAPALVQVGNSPAVPIRSVHLRNKHKPKRSQKSKINVHLILVHRTALTTQWNLQ